MTPRWFGLALALTALVACTRLPTGGTLGHLATATPATPPTANPLTVEPLPVPAVGPLGLIFPPVRPSPSPDRK